MNTPAPDPTTQQARFVALMTEFGINPEVAPMTANPDLNAITLQPGDDLVVGYGTFFCEFAFNPDGTFNGVGIWE